MLKLNQIHLQIINKVICVLEFLGLSLWKIKQEKSGEKVVFSIFALVNSVLIILIVARATISQLWNAVPEFDTAHDTDATKLINIVSKCMIYGFTPVVFIPIWCLHKKMRLILEKLLKIKRILSKISVDVSKNCYSVSLLLKTFVLFSAVMIIISFEVKIGTSLVAHNKSFPWLIFLSHAIPSLFKHFCVLHFIILMGLMATRITQICSILENLVESREIIVNK